MKPVTAARAGRAVGFALLGLALIWILNAALFSLGMGVGLFWRAVRWTNGW